MQSKFMSGSSVHRLAASLLGALALTAQLATAATYTAEDYKRAVSPCLQAHDYACAQKNMEQYLRLRPDDTAAMVNLGQIMGWRDDQQGAIAQYEKAISLGEGAYNLFAYYADSLGKVGRIDEAIDWSYKTLSIVPTLVDVRGNLAKLLLRQKKYYEALALLSSYDEQLIRTGNQPYFTGQRIAIESVIERVGASAATSEQSLRLSKLGSSFVAPLTIGEARPTPFIVDTGASRLTVSENYLLSSKQSYKVVNAHVRMVTADGHAVVARAITLDTLRVGPFVIKDVPAVACNTCALLLGQSALEKFDMKSSKVQGVEFMTLSPRKL